MAGQKDTSLPWERTDTVVTEDNVHASLLRYDAIKAVKAGKATAEQRKLLADCDKVMQEAMATRSR